VDCTYITQLKLQK